jgi:hypothetical protein
MTVKIGGATKFKQELNAQPAKGISTREAFNLTQVVAFPRIQVRSIAELPAVPSAAEVFTKAGLDLSQYDKAIVTGRKAKLHRAWTRFDISYTFNRHLVKLEGDEAVKLYVEELTRLAAILHLEIYGVPFESVFVGSILPNEYKEYINYTRYVFEAAIVIGQMKTPDLSGECSRWLKEMLKGKGITILN